MRATNVKVARYISDTFEEHNTNLVKGKDANVVWVPKEARCSHLQSRAKLPSIGKVNNSVEIDRGL